MRLICLLPNRPSVSETFIGTELRALHAQGMQLGVLILGAPQVGTGQPQDGVLAQWQLALPALRIPAVLRLVLAAWRRWPGLFWYLLRQRRLPSMYLLKQGLRIGLMARLNGAEHLHAHYLNIAPYAIVAARLAGISCSAVGHGYDIYRYAPAIRAELRALDRVFAVCGAVRADFLSHCPRACVSLLPCGVELDRFEPPAAGPQRAGFLIVAHLCEKKGIDVALRAFAQLDPGRRGNLYLVGEGPWRERLSILIEELGLESAVVLDGWRDAEWIRDRLAQVRALVLSSRIAADGDRDTGPVVCKEALAAGVPVIASRCMGLPEIVDESCGRLVAVDDVGATAQAMREIMLAPTEVWRGLSAAARQRAERCFDARRLGAELAQLLRNTAVEHGRPGRDRPGRH